MKDKSLQLIRLHGILLWKILLRNRTLDATRGSSAGFEQLAVDLSGSNNLLVVTRSFTALTNKEAQAVTKI